jgi:hypothetical protein
LFELSFCSSEREKKKEEKKYGRDCSPVGQWNSCLSVHSARA